MRKSAPGGRNSACKGPEAGACLERAERSKEGDVAEQEGIREDEAKR